MLSARAVYHEICDGDEARRLFWSVTAKGGARAGWGDARIAALSRDDVFRSKLRPDTSPALGSRPGAHAR